MRLYALLRSDHIDLRIVQRVLELLLAAAAGHRLRRFMHGARRAVVRDLPFDVLIGRALARRVEVEFHLLA